MVVGGVFSNKKDAHIFDNKACDLFCAAIAAVEVLKRFRNKHKWLPDIPHRVVGHCIDIVIAAAAKCDASFLVEEHKQWVDALDMFK